MPVSTLHRLSTLCDTGGAVAVEAALAQMALAAGFYAAPVRGAKAVPEVGAWVPEEGVCCPILARGDALALDGGSGVGAQGAGTVLVVFYRAYLVAADLGPVEALFGALRARGFHVAGLFAPSLKEPGAAGWLQRQVAAFAPVAVVNATAFFRQGR